MKPQRILAKSKNWKSFKSHLKTLRNKDKGDAFELLTKYYLKLHPTYTTQLKHVWLLSEVPSKVHRKLNLPSTDEGIDLIAETKSGTYWAIQCKYKEDETKSLTRKELSTFTDLAFSVCRNLELALVCTNTDRISHKLKMHGDRISYCAGEVWRSLDEIFFKRIQKHLKGKVAPIKKAAPREHQKRAIKSAYKHFVKEKNPRGKLIMPCGTGKSLAGYWIADKLEAKKILVAVPSLALIRQTLEVWAKESVANKQQVNWIAVCSDKSVGDIEKDDIAVFTQDLGIKVHTDPKEISQWLKRRHVGKTVVFSTYQSGKAIAQAAKKAELKFDMAIMDEAHKTVGKADSFFSHLLYEKNIKIKKRIFMTATERRYRGQSEQILSMEDPKAYGETFEMLSFKKALEAKPAILSDYKIVTIFVSKNEVKELIKKNLFVRPDKGKWDREVEAEMLASLVALRKAMKKHSIKKAVSFHSSIARAMAFKKSQDVFTRSFRSYGKLKTFHVTGKLPTSVRAREVGDFSKSTRSLITNARCLTEGVDVPNIDCVLFADPKRSTVDIVQAVGRALRPHKGKKYGYVIVPVLINDNLKGGKKMSQEAFDSILITLRALAADDERMIEYFHLAPKKTRPGPRTDFIDFMIDDGLEIDTNNFINSIQLKIWSRLEKLYLPDLNIKEILAWADEHKNRTGRWPTGQSGKVIGTVKEKWKNIDNCLRGGGRGLAGESSIAKLLQEYRGRRNLGDLSDLTEEMILKWADKHFKENGEWPNKTSGIIIGTDGETWRNIDNSLHTEGRGLKGGKTLAKLLYEQRGASSPKHRSNLNEKMILDWADEHYEEMGEWPTLHSGEIKGTGENWKRINNYLKAGERGLEGNSSLIKLLNLHRGVRDKARPPTLTDDQIIKWAENHKKKTGEWPTIRSGKVLGQLGESWSAISTALRAGIRGLKGGSSLSKLLHTKKKVIIGLPPYKIKQILTWADEHMKRAGEWPNIFSGLIQNQKGETWQKINGAFFSLSIMLIGPFKDFPLCKFGQSFSVSPFSVLAKNFCYRKSSRQTSCAP